MDPELQLVPIDEGEFMFLTEKEEWTKRGAVLDVNGSRLTITEAHGPFSALMRLPPQVLRAMPTAVLAAHRDSRRIYLVGATIEAPEETEVGCGFHSHALDRAEGVTQTDGAHRHVFLVEEAIALPNGMELAAGTVLITEEDGAHQHALAEHGLDTQGESEHVHGILVNDEQVLQTLPEAQHQHRLMVRSTGLGGDHQHELVIGETTLVSLHAGDLSARFEELMAPAGLPAPPSADGDGAVPDGSGDAEGSAAA